MASKKITWYEAPPNTDTTVFSNTPASGQQWVEWLNKGKTYYAIVPITTSQTAITASHPKDLSKVTLLAPATAQQNYNAANGSSSGSINPFAIGDKVTMPDWKAYAIDAGIDPAKLPASLIATSGKPVSVTTLTKITGASQDFGTNLFNALQALTVDQSTKATSGAAKQVIAYYFSRITGNTNAGNIILENWQGQHPNEIAVKNLNSLMKGLTTVLESPAYNGDLSKVQPGAITLTGSIGGTAKVVANTIGTNGSPTAPGANTIYGSSNTGPSTQINALSAVEQELASWGMDSGSLVSKIKNLIFAQGDHVVSTGQLNDFIRSQPEYEQAFPGLAKYNQNAAKIGMKPITENAYLSLQDSYTNTARNFDLPNGFLTKANIAKLIEGGVSAKEFEDRIMMGYNAAKNADPQTRAILQQQYGLSQGDLTAYFLNPKTAESTLTNRMASASLQGYAKNVGLEMSQAGGESLANMIRSTAMVGTASGAAVQNPYANVTMQSAEAAISKSAQDAQLQKSLPGSNMPTVSADQMIGAQVAGYMGTNQVAEQAQVGRAEQARVAPFEKGGGYAETGKGVTGLGSARQ